VFANTEIIKNTRFDAYTMKNPEFIKAESYLRDRWAAETNKTANFTPNSTYEKVIQSVLPVYLRSEPDFTGDSVYYYSPCAVSRTPSFATSPSNYEVTNKVLPAGCKDDFKFYANKIVAKNLRWSFKNPKPGITTATINDILILEADIYVVPQFINIFNTIKLVFDIQNYSDNGATTYLSVDSNSTVQTITNVKATLTLNFKNIIAKPHLMFRIFQDPYVKSEFCKIPFRL